MKYLFLLFCFSIQATTYYVRKDGSDSNTGTADNAGGAWLTIQKGVNTAVSNDIVNVRAGVYQENVTSARGAFNGSKIVFDGGNVAQLWSFLSTHSNITFQNFTLAGKASAWWFFMGKGAHFNTISNCIFDAEYNTSASLILRWDNPTPVTETPFGGNLASGCLIISNLFKRVAGTTVVSVYGDTNIVLGNRLFDGDACDWFHIWGRSNKVIGNFCSNDIVSGLSANHPDFFQAFGANGAGTMACVIESNIVMNMEGDCQLGILEGQDCPDIGDYTFRNNLFIGISKPFMAAMPNVYFYNNTFYQCNTNEVGGSGGAAIIYTSAEWTGSVESPPGIYTNYTSSTAIGGRCYNNLFLDCGGPELDRGWYTFSSDLTNISADYNFISKNGYKSVITNLLHQRIGDAGGWQKFQWWEDHGINGGNPGIVSSNSLNFRLVSTSILINAGTNLSGKVDNDFDGISRPQGALWDIGAFEFFNGPTSTPGRGKPSKGIGRK